MNPNEFTVTIQQHPHKKSIQFLVLAAYGVCIYYVLHPEQAEKIQDRLQEVAALVRDKLVYQLHVWETVQAIRSLPETD